MQKVKRNSFLLLDSFEALGTLFWVECFDFDLREQKEKQEILRKELEGIITFFEQSFSRFKKDSITYHLSRGERVKGGTDLRNMLLFGEHLEENTEGLFSLYRGDELSQKGYGVKEEFEVVVAPLKEKIYSIDSGDSISLSRPRGVDFGGVGKGYLIDKIATFLQEKEVSFFLVNGGGDMYVTSDNGEPIHIHLENPTVTSESLGQIALYNKGFAASSSFKRVWQKDGKDRNHFVTKGDEVWGASFVVAENALVADALATAVIVMLPDVAKGDTLLQKYEASGFLMSEDGVFLTKDFPPIE